LQLPERKPYEPTDWRHGWTPEPVWTLWRIETYLVLVVNEDIIFVVQSVAFPLYQLSYHGSLTKHYYSGRQENGKFNMKF
jgi:hypothetical protein